ncbi:MAG TPA: HYR domain-containing protein [Polyangia bacterium]
MIGFLALLLAVPHEGRAGLTAQGLTAQGLTAQGLTAQGLTAQGLTAQGLTAQGLTAQGLTAQGLTAQGLTAQGLTAQGLTAQGLTAQGVVVQGTDVVAASLKGTTIGSVDLRGTDIASPIVPYELTDGASISSGPGDYISVGGRSAVGHYAVAHLLDPSNNPAEDIDLYIAGERPDPIPNLFHRADEQQNDVTLYTVYYFHKWSGQWYSLCPFNPLTNDASAIAIPEDPFAHPNKFIFACTASGVASKCARNWGYRPWQNTTAWVFGGTDWAEQTFGLKDYYNVCKIAARAGYCQDGKSFTKAGTLVDLYDTRQIIWPNAIENPFDKANPDSLWMMAQEYFVSFDPATGAPTMQASALQRTRYRELSPVGDCADLADIDRLEHDHFEDGRWANPLTGTPRIQVFSPNYCTHHEDTPGEGLPWDCSPCTKAVCRTNPECCTNSPGAAGWTPACVSKRALVCQDVVDGVTTCDDNTPPTRPCWPVGRVWPDDEPVNATRSTKFLQGAGGVVERVDGVSSGGSAATVVGWACDPEWPGAAVSVDLYGGAPIGQAGSVPLGRVYADQALAAPLALEVSAACDGANLTSARHGFSFPLTMGLTGNVFAYAIDAATADGPAAPPSLLRNGIVHVPTCAHSEHLTGDALPAACSACAASVCGKGGLGDCCTVGWTDACAAAAESCSTIDASAATDGYAFAAATTGWIEAPASGVFTFQSATQPSRLFINGVKVFDWFDAPGTTQGTIDLVQGGKYALRWDRFQSAPDPAHPGVGLTWQLPGAGAQTAIPASLLYKVAPGIGNGLFGLYTATLGFPFPFTSIDPGIDFSSKTPVPEGVVTPFTVTWQGDVVAAVDDTYTFYVVGDGGPDLRIDGTSVLLPDPPANNDPPACSHDICDIGEKLAASTLAEPACNPCVDAICNPASPTADLYCCNGGYLSYYSTEPEWDAKCVAEVASICHVDCKRPPPNPIGTQHKTIGIPLQAGVRHHLSLSFPSVASLTSKLQLQWSSPSQNKQVIPAGQLFPSGAPANRGAGLNVVTFATKQQGGSTVADLNTLLASSSVPDLSTTAPVGANGLPQINVLAATDDPIAGAPPRPAVVVPPYNGHAVGVGGSFAVTVSGIGGVRGGSVTVTVDASLASTEIPVDASGNFSGAVAVGAAGPHTLHFHQRTFTGGGCVAPALCAQSATLDWTFNADSADPATAPAPTILSPRDPTASLDPTITTFAVIGHGVPGVPLDIVDLGGPGHSPSSPLQLTVDGSGNFSDTITLSPGTLKDANPGWHKLVFSQGGGAVTNVFVSVGVRPPTVEFPRTEAVIDCTKPDQPIVEALGTFPYDPTVFGKLFFTEETGTSTIRPVAVRELTVGPPVPNPDGTVSFPFIAHALGLGSGKHLVNFFQLPPLPAGSTPAQILAHVRGFAAIAASTPKSRITINVPPFRIPPAFADPSVILKTPNGIVLGPPAPVPGQVNPCGAGATAPDPQCVFPFADVNIKIGARLFTVRADANGAWQFRPTFPLGFSELTLTQVVDSPAGGGWSESCPSGSNDVGVGSLGVAPSPIVPSPITVPALGPAGTPVPYTVGVFANGLTAVHVICTPASGSTFPIGTTNVDCAAIDDVTKAVGIGFFSVTVVDEPPLVNVPPGGITAEATDHLGAFVSYDVTATDAVSGPLPVQCAPAAPPGSPALFLLDQDTTVSCQATDGAMQTTTATFVVRVRDTTPPVLCDLPDKRVDANQPGGAIVTFATCATDVVDGADPVTCNHPSGSFFPLGKTTVTCFAVDNHGNRSPSDQFIVTVGDTTPPVLMLPGTITATATKRTGVKVTYTVTATDDGDPHPKVVCAPPSGSTFPIGTTVVTCTATDASGNQSHGSFKVHVVVAWSGLLFPIVDDSSRFIRGLPVLVRFRLTGASVTVDNLPARLFIAPVDAQGHVGVERAAFGLPPGVGNQFLQLPLLGEYDLVMDTLSMQTGRWQLRVDLGDGEVHTTRITLVF